MRFPPNLLATRVVTAVLIALAPCLGWAAGAQQALVPSANTAYPPGVQGQPDTVAQCLICHGPTGLSQVPEFPVLAGQKADYLLQQLQAFRDGKRTNAMMRTAVSHLNAEDLAVTARYFSEQRGLASPRAGASSRTGRSVPSAVKSCVACHAEANMELDQTWPHLGSQSAHYLEVQLRAFRDGTRKSAIMKPMVGSMTDAEIREVAEYYAGF